MERRAAGQSRADHLRQPIICNPRYCTLASPPIARCAAAQPFAAGEAARLAPDRWGLQRAGEQKAPIFRPLEIEATQALRMRHFDVSPHAQCFKSERPHAAKKVSK